MIALSGNKWGELVKLKDGKLPRWTGFFHFDRLKIRQSLIWYAAAGIYVLKKIRNYTKTKVQNGKTLPKLNIDIYSKFNQYYRYNIIMYDFIHII